jgi:hypothetical protein
MVAARERGAGALKSGVRRERRERSRARRQKKRFIVIRFLNEVVFRCEAT